MTRRYVGQVVLSGRDGTDPKGADICEILVARDDAPKHVTGTPMTAHGFKVALAAETPSEESR